MPALLGQDPVDELHVRRDSLHTAGAHVPYREHAGPAAAKIGAPTRRSYVLARGAGETHNCTTMLTGAMAAPPTGLRDPVRLRVDVAESGHLRTGQLKDEMSGHFHALFATYTWYLSLSKLAYFPAPEKYIPSTGRLAPHRRLMLACEQE